MYMNPDCSVCFSAMFLCASQLHHLVLPSIFAFFLPGFDSAAFGSLIDDRRRSSIVTSRGLNR